MSVKPFTLEDNAKIENILQIYGQKYGELIDAHGHLRDEFLLFRPHNRFIGLDNNTIHIVLSFNDAFPDMMMDNRSDLRDFGVVSSNEVIAVCQRDLGYRDVAYLSLPASLLSQSPAETEAALTKISEDNFQQELKHLLMQTKNLNIPTDLVRRFISDTTEDNLTQHILIPLLRQMGFARVKQKEHDETVLEHSQDIRNLKLKLPTGHYLYFATQVKRGKIDVPADSKNEITTILNELRNMFDSAIFDYDVNKSTKIDYALLVSSGIITEAARNLIDKTLENEIKRRILFIDSEDIVDFCAKYGLPLDVQQEIEKFYKKPS
ncbi:MAG TPA: hypothetical protein VED00_00820 [archaeon]|nr:hypothetical protein [archaeon]